MEISCYNMVMRIHSPSFPLGLALYSLISLSGSFPMEDYPSRADVARIDTDKNGNGGTRQCTAHNRQGKRCLRSPVSGASVCFLHGGASPTTRATAKMRLMCLVEPALETLLDAMEQRDHWPSAVRAAETLLDRAGFHAKLGLVHEEERPDLQSLTKEQLAVRAQQLAMRIRDAHLAEVAMKRQQEKSEHPPSGDSSVH